MAGMDDIEVPLTLSFPLPFRVLVLAGLGILGWATNLHGLSISRIDVVSAMGLRVEGHSEKSLSNPASALYGPVYRIFISYSIISFASWTIFRSATYGNIMLVDTFGYIPGVTALIFLLILVCPFNIIFKRERDKFLRTVRRCLLSSMDSPVYFADVVFADIFTSFAKVLGDLWLSSCMLLPGNSVLTRPSYSGWMRWISPTIMSIPYLVRFRQCIIEYAAPENESRRPLFNALKYATSFPVIYLSAAQKLVISDIVKEKGEEVVKGAWHGEHHLFRLWLLTAVVNSLYSFWWDVTNDWGLELLKPAENPRPSPLRRLVLPHLHSSSPLLVSHSPRHSTELNHLPANTSHHPYHPYSLRSVLLYPLPVYPLLVFINLVLRLTWSIELSSHLHSRADGSVVIFWLEVAEIFRRWMWVFIRVEWEVIKKGQHGTRRARVDDLSGDDADYELVPPTPDEDSREIP